jgi:acyl-CoA reductase-like NAD-dependent aldehyde dehydrogenase
MQINSDKIDFLVGDFEILNSMPETPALPMFSDIAVGFLAALSRGLMLNPEAKKYVDVVSYAYWIRKGSIEAAKDKHIDYENRIGRGVALHIAPSNVPVNFAVSMTSSLLAGNATIIRLSAKTFAQADIICGEIKKLLDGEFKALRGYICIVRYEHDEEITAALSSICDLRIIWGGNRTIESIRKAPLPPRAVEMTFADRHSIAIINADTYLECDPGDIARKFYTDTYYTDQNACSSPRIIIWTGNKTDEAGKRFWEELEALVLKEYDMKPIQAIDKLSSFTALAMSGYGARLLSKDNYVVRIEVDSLDEKLMDYKNSGGFFFEYVIKKDLGEIVPLLGKSCQTVSVLGVDKGAVKEIVFRHGVRGVDRIVDLGQTMALEFIWDGYRMIEAMTRLIYV